MPCLTRRETILSEKGFSVELSNQPGGGDGEEPAAFRIGFGLTVQPMKKNIS